MKNKQLLSIKSKNGEIRVIQQLEKVLPEDYLEIGAHWFTLENFYENTGISFKVSTLKRKNKEGIPTMVFDFICLTKDGEESVNKNPEKFNIIVGKLTIMAQVFVRNISISERKNYSFIIRQAEPWMLEDGPLKKEKVSEKRSTELNDGFKEIDNWMEKYNGR